MNDGAPDRVGDGEAKPDSVGFSVLMGAGTFLVVVMASLGSAFHAPWWLALVGFVFALAAANGEDRTRTAALSVGVAASLVCGLVAYIVVEWLQFGESSQASWLVLAPVGVWLGTSIIVHRSSTSNGVRESFWQWVTGHKTLAGSLGLVYVAAAGLVHETRFYDRLGLSAMHYVDPGDLAYATLSDLTLAFSAAVGALLALAVIMKLWHRVATRPQWGGQSEDEGQHDWADGALSFLALPARSISVVRMLIIFVVATIFLAVPFGIATVTADDAFGSINLKRAGTLWISRPAKYVEAVRHVASTSSHMVVVYSCGSTSDKPNGSAVHRTQFDDAGAAFTDTLRWVLLRLGVFQPDDGKVEDSWRPIVVPWNAVSSFNLEDAVSAANDGANAENEKGGEVEATTKNCSPAWKADLSGPGPGLIGPKGDSVDIQYSRQGTVEAEWFDEPSQDDRYIRFRVGEGEWEPPDGIRIAGSKELWYGVSFDRFGLVEEVESQLQIESAIPSLGPTCRTVVTGCASKTPFLHACAAKSGATCTPCMPGGTCHASIARWDDVGGVMHYDAADGLLQHIGDTRKSQCAGDIRKCIEEANGVLNCGAANLRAVATAAKLGGVGIHSVLDGFGVSFDMEDTEESPMYTSARLLVQACERVADRDLRGIALKAANESPGMSQCWQPSKSSLNHAAIIRLIGDGAGKFGGCVEVDASRNRSVRTPDV